MNRRHFLAGLASTLFLPYDPKRIYSFGSEVGRVRLPEWTIHRTSVGVYDITFNPSDYVFKDGDWGPAARVEIVEGLLGYVDPDGDPKPLITREFAPRLLDYPAVDRANGIVTLG